MSFQFSGVWGPRALRTYRSDASTQGASWEVKSPSLRNPGLKKPGSLGSSVFILTATPVSFEFDTYCLSPEMYWGSMPSSLDSGAGKRLVFVVEEIQV